MVENKDEVARRRLQATCEEAAPSAGQRSSAVRASVRSHYDSRRDVRRKNGADKIGQEMTTDNCCCLRSERELKNFWLRSMAVWRFCSPLIGTFVLQLYFCRVRGCRRILGSTLWRGRGRKGSYVEIYRERLGDGERTEYGKRRIEGEMKRKRERKIARTDAVQLLASRSFDVFTNVKLRLIKRAPSCLPLLLYLSFTHLSLSQSRLSVAGANLSTISENHSALLDNCKSNSFRGWWSTRSSRVELRFG